MNENDLGFLETGLPQKDIGLGLLDDWAAPIETPPPIETKPEFQSRPSDIEIEQKVINLMLTIRGMVNKFRDMGIRADHFDFSHRPLVERIFEAADNNVLLTDNAYRAYVIEQSKRADKRARVDVPASMRVYETCWYGVDAEPDDFPWLSQAVLASYVDRKAHQAITDYYDDRKKGDIHKAVGRLAESLGSATTSASQGTIRNVAIKYMEDHRAEHSESEWVWDGFIRPGHITVFGGYPKVGKTTLIAYLLEQTKAGGHLYTDVAPCKTLVITEESMASWLDRQEQFDFGERRLLTMRGIQCPTTQEFEAEMAAVFEAVEEHHVGMVVFDTASKLLPAVKENEADSWNMAFSLLNESLVKKSNVAVVLVHHATKNAEATHGKQLRGSSALAGAADIIVIVDRDGETRRKVVSLGRNVDPQEFHYRVEGGHLEVEGDSETARAYIADKLLSILDKPKTEAEIRKALDIPRTNSQRLIAKALKAKSITKGGAGTSRQPFQYVRVGLFNQTMDSATEDIGGEW